MTSLAGHISWGQPSLVPQSPGCPERQQQLRHLHRTFARSQEQRRLLLRGRPESLGAGTVRESPPTGSRCPPARRWAPPPLTCWIPLVLGCLVGRLRRGSPYCPGHLYPLQPGGDCGRLGRCSQQRPSAVQFFLGVPRGSRLLRSWGSDSYVLVSHGFWPWWCGEEDRATWVLHRREALPRQPTVGCKCCPGDVMGARAGQWVLFWIRGTRVSWSRSHRYFFHSRFMDRDKMCS